MDIEKKVQERWGSPEAYYKEKEDFLKKHESADTVVVCDKDKMLVKVEYYFRPYQAYLEHLTLLRRLLGEASEVLNEPEGK